MTLPPPFGATAVIVAMLWAARLGAADLPVLAGPAMGTTYRVVLAAEIAGLSPGEVHREIETVLARVDAAASTWRQDSDASRFNRAPAGVWVTVGDDLARIVAIARAVHAETDGAFDITVGPLVRLWRDDRQPSAARLAEARQLTGMALIESRPAVAGARAALRKLRAGVELDLAGIGTGYGVDCVGDRLAALGSPGHLVEVGGEARAWGLRPDGGRWRVAGATAGGHVRELPPGVAVAFATAGPGRILVDPRTGRPATVVAGTFEGEAGTCAVADARAVARALAPAIGAATSRPPSAGTAPD